MTLSFAGWLLVLALPFVLGVGVLRFLGIDAKSDRLAFVGWAWMAGTFAQGLILLVWLLSEPDLDSGAMPAAAMVFLGVLAFAVARRFVRCAECDVTAAGTPAWERVLFALVLVLGLALVLERIAVGTLSPILTDDEGNFWALKAKVIFHNGGLNAAFGAEMSDPTWVYNKDYPLLNPLLQVWSFVTAKGILHVENRVPIQLFALAQALVLLSALRRVVRPAVAVVLWAGVLATLEARLQTGLAHGDLMVGFGALVAVDAWHRYRTSGAVAWVRLAALGLAFMLWSKNEGLLYLVAWALAFGLSRVMRGRNPLALARCAWLALVPSAAVLALHWGLNAHFGFGSGFVSNELREASMATLFFQQFGERAPEVLRFYGGEILFAPAHSHWILPAALGLSLLALARRAPVALWVPGLAIGLALAAQMAVFIGAPHALEWHLNTAARRIAFQLVPLAALCLAVSWRGSDADAADQSASCS